MSEKYKDNEILIRQAKKEDMSAVVEMIQELADFEKMPDGPKLSVEDLTRDGFETQPPAFKCKVAEVQTDGVGSVVGYAVYFPTYSTWEGRALMLEDLYVRSAGRRRGAGARLLHALAEEAVSTGCRRLDFHVLEWNPACAFYARAGAADLSAADGWRCYRLAGAALRRVASTPHW